MFNPSRLMLAAFGGGLIAAALEISLRASAHSAASALAALGLGCAFGCVLGLLSAALAWGCARWFTTPAPSWRDPALLTGSMALVAAVACLNLNTFSGAWVRERAWAPLARLSAHALVFLLAWGALHTLRRAHGTPRRWSVAVAGALTAIAAASLDRNFLAGLYPGIHATLQLATALAAMAALWLLLPEFSARTVRTCVAFALGGALASGLALHSDIVLRSHFSNAGPVTTQFVALLAPADASDAWITRRAGAAAWLSQRPQRVVPGSALAEELDQRLPKRRSMNLLIVSVDTLRADRLGHGGAPRPKAPFLDKLAAEATVFTNAYTNYPISSFAYSSMFSGRIPSASPAGQLLAGKAPIWGSNVALAELLGGAGFETAAFSAFNAESIAREEAFGHLTHGFAAFTPERRLEAWEAGELVTAATAALPRITQKRFFLWLHLLDPHAPYRQHEGVESDGTPEGDYDAEVRYTDGQLQRFFEQLEAAGQRNNTIVVVMGDHGEEFGEHGHRFHGTTLYEEQVRVPIFFVIPGLRPRTVTEPVSVMDIMPTAVDLLGVADSQRRDGTTLVPAILGRGPGPGCAYAELEPTQQVSSGRRRMLVEGGHKLIVDSIINAFELYDLKADPRELTNLAGRDPDRVAWMQALMNALQTETPGDTDLLQLEALLNSVASANEAHLDVAMWTLFNALYDPVFSITRRYGTAVRGPLRERVLAALERCARSTNANAAVPAMRLAANVDAPGLWQRVQDIPTVPDLRWQVEYALLRAAAGDPRVGEALRNALLIDGMPEKQRIADQAMRRGQQVNGTLVSCVLRSRNVEECASMLRAFLRFAPQDALLVLGDLVDHPHWLLYAPVRRAAVGVLAACADSAEKTALLARYACDDDAEVARAAADPLARLAHNDLKKWMDCADLAARAEENLVHLDLKAAHERLAAAVSACSENTRVQLQLARVEQVLGLTEFAVQRLHGLAARGERLSVEAQRRIDHPLDVRGLMEAAITLSAAEFSGDSKALLQSWYGFRFTLTNTSAITLPGGVRPTALSLIPKLIAENGAVIPVPTATAILIGERDLIAGEARAVFCDFLAPAAPGIYGLAVEPQILLPHGAVRVLPVITIVGARLDVRDTMDGSDLIPR